MLGLEIDGQAAPEEALEVRLGLLYIDRDKVPFPHILDGLHLLRGLFNIGHTPAPVVVTGRPYQVLKLGSPVPVELVLLAEEKGLSLSWSCAHSLARRLSPAAIHTASRRG